MSAAARLRSVINAWETVRYELLNTRVCDLGLRLKDSPIEPYLHQLEAEFKARKFVFQPRFYLSDSWGCPDEVPIIGIPFYLADKRLMRIEEEQTGEVEDADELMQYLRHEGGHSINYAYRLWEDPEWTSTFGRFSKAYRDAFDPDPFSRNFVRHIAHGRLHRATYAQKHPDEDFAETFAVWLKPRSGWRRRYENWPAMKKLLYVERLMKRVARQQPLRTSGPLVEPVSGLTMTLAEHYGQRAERFRAKAQGYVDDKLRIIFPELRAGVPSVPAQTFLRRRRRTLTTRIAHWSGMAPEEIEMVLVKLEDRARSLGLRARDDASDIERLVDVASLVTAMAVQFSTTGGFGR
jgi:hypothetical protein